MASNHHSSIHSYQLKRLVTQLEDQAETSRATRKSEIKQQRRLHHSQADVRDSFRYQKPSLFNNKTKAGSVFEKNPPQAPYLFIPKYKNETFIMPDRVFQKGLAGKRFHIKMKDTSIYSFQDQEKGKINNLLRKQKKRQVINSRKMEEYSRIINENDGRQRAQRATQSIRNRRIFNPTRTTSDQFSIIDPLLEPRQDQTFQIKKVSLNKTFGPNLWRPASKCQNMRKTDTTWGIKTDNLHRTASHHSHRI